MAMGEQPLDRVQAPAVVGQPIAIGPRQAEREKDDARKDRRRRSPRQSIEDTLDEEQELREGGADDSQSHIDYHA
jgi:hypothetical protein